jgi:hypothetical protein
MLRANFRAITATSIVAGTGKVAVGDLKTSISEASRTTRAGCRNATAVGVRGNPDRRVAITERPAVTLQVQNPDPSTYERVQGVLVRLQ